MRITLSQLSGFPPVHRAAGEGNIDELRRLYDADADVNARHDSHPSLQQHFPLQNGLTPLMVAAAGEQSSAACVAWLLAHGADAQQTSVAGVNALWYAAAAGMPERIAVLVPYGQLELAVGGETDATGQTAVVAAALAGSHASLRKLLRAGASPHTVSEAAPGHPSSNIVPLFAAAEGGSAACIKVLLAHGVAPDTRDAEGRTALTYAGSASVVRTLVAAGCMLTEQDSTMAIASVLQRRHRLEQRIVRTHPTSWHEPRRHSERVTGLQLRILAALLDAGAELNPQDGDILSPLLYAAEMFQDSPKAIALLLARGADVHARDTAGRTVLHRLATSSTTAPVLNTLIRLLTRAGLSINVRDSLGKTPLHLAVSRALSRSDSATALLRRGADVDAGDTDGMTPLMVAASSPERNYAVVRQLLAAGANPARVSNAGQTAYELARARTAVLRENLHVAADTVDPQDMLLGIFYNGPAREVFRPAEGRTVLRIALSTLALLGTPIDTPELETFPAELPPPIWLGYRAVRPRALPEHWANSPSMQHVMQVANFGHELGVTPLMNASGCYASPEALRSEQDQMGEHLEQPREVHAYSAYPLIFEHSGHARHTTAEALLGDQQRRPQPPDLAQYECIGYDIKECRPNAMWGLGCAPLSPYCNGWALGLGGVVNSRCLIHDVASAYDLAVIFGIVPPEPGPYIIVAVWRRMVAEGTPTETVTGDR